MRLFLAAVISIGALAQGAHAHDDHDTTTLASCSATNPRVGANLAIDDANGCTASFTIAQAREVTSVLAPPAGYAGTLGLRVRGPNALWTKHDAVFVAGNLVAGNATSTFLIQPGTWQLEVFIDDMSSDIGSLHQIGYGTFAGRVDG